MRRPPRGRGFGGGGGGFRGGRCGGGRGFRGGGGGRGFGAPRDEEVSSFVHACEGDAVTRLTNEKIPYFAPIYLHNKTQIGKVDEIFGPINESLFSIKMMEGIIATSYNAGDKFYIDPAKLLPLARFVPQPKKQQFVEVALRNSITGQQASSTPQLQRRQPPPATTQARDRSIRSLGMGKKGKKKRHVQDESSLQLMNICGSSSPSKPLIDVKYDKMPLNFKKKFYIDDECDSMKKYIDVISWLRTMACLDDSVFEGVSNLNLSQDYPLVEIDVFTPEQNSSKF